MTLSLIPAEDVYPGDLMEDFNKVFYPVMSIDNPRSSMWFWYTLGPQRVRTAARGDYVLVGRVTP
jgi:hypothetical protein